MVRRSRSGLKWFKGPRLWPALLLGAVLVGMAVLATNHSMQLSVLLGLLAAGTLGYLGKEAPKLWTARQQEGEQRRVLTRAATSTATNGGDAVFLVSETPPGWFRHRRAVFQLDYQPRDAEKETREVLDRQEPLLLVGPSMAGKSRLIEHLVTADFPNQRLWLPTPADLPAVLRAGTMCPAVVCLDDLERYLNVAELRADWLSILSAGGATVVATMRGSELDKFTTLEGMRHPQLNALDQFTVVRLRDDNPDENDRLSRAIPEPQRDAVRRVGLGAFLGGGAQAQARLENNRDQHRLGYAMVRAAADWRRLGLTWISQPELAQLAPHYLPDRHRHNPQESADDALAWATRVIDETVQLLQDGPGNTILCTDYIYDYLTQSAPLPPEAIWELATITQTSTRGELLNLGVNAGRLERPNVARDAFMRVIASGDDGESSVAWFNIGVNHEKAGEFDAARAAYNKAADARETVNVATAMFNLGALEQEAGNVVEARAIYKDVIDSGEPTIAALTWSNVAFLELEAANPDGARVAYKNVVDSGDPELFPEAGFHLGLLEVEAGDLAAARAAYHYATKSGDPELVPKSWQNLARIEAVEGNWEEARIALRHITGAGDPKYAPMAWSSLGALERLAGNPAAARAAYEKAGRSASPEARQASRDALAELDDEVYP